MSDWNPLGWAQLTEQKSQNNYNDISAPWMKFADMANGFFKTQQEQNYQVNTLLPAQTEAQKGLAAYTQGLPMSPYQSKELEVQQSMAEKAAAAQERLSEKYSELINARSDEQKRTLQAEIDSLRLDLKNAQQDLQNYASSQKNSSTGTAAQSAALDKFLGQMGQRFGAFDAATSSYNWDILAKPETLKIIHNLLPKFLASSGLTNVDVKAAQDYLDGLIMGGGQPTTPGQGQPISPLRDLSTSLNPRLPTGVIGGQGSFTSPSDLFKPTATTPGAPLFGEGSVPQTQNAGIAGIPRITPFNKNDFEYRQSRGGGKILVNKKTGLEATAEEKARYAQ